MCHIGRGLDSENTTISNSITKSMWQATLWYFYGSWFLISLIFYFHVGVWNLLRTNLIYLSLIFLAGWSVFVVLLHVYMHAFEDREHMFQVGHREGKCLSWICVLSLNKTLFTSSISVDFFLMYYMHDFYSCWYSYGMGLRIHPNIMMMDFKRQYMNHFWSGRH